MKRHPAKMELCDVHAPSRQYLIGEAAAAPDVDANDTASFSFIENEAFCPRHGEWIGVVLPKLLFLPGFSKKSCHLIPLLRIASA
jgi:hypothetical protein